MTYENPHQNKWLIKGNLELPWNEGGGHMKYLFHGLESIKAIWKKINPTSPFPNPPLLELKRA